MKTRKKDRQTADANNVPLVTEHCMQFNHGLLRAWNSVDLVPVNPKAAISSLHQVRTPIKDLISSISF